MTMTPIQIKQGWKEVRLGDYLTKIIGGGTPSKSKPEYWNGDLLWASVKDMSDGVYRLYTTQDRITEIGLKNSSSNLIPKKTLVISTRMGLGRIFKSIYNITINQDLKAIFPKSSLSNDFLLWLYIFNSEKIIKLGTGSTVKGVRLEDIRNLQITLPPLPIQDKIAEVLGNYDDLIEGNNRRIQILESMAAKIYTEWFVHYRYPGSENVPLVDSGTEYGEIPLGWEVRKLGDIADIVSGYAFKSKDFQKSGIPVIKIKNIKGNNMVDCIDTDFVSEDLNTLKLEKYILTNGDVLVAMTGATAGKAGRVCTKNTLFLNQRVAKIKPKETIFYPFCWSRLESDESQNELYDLAGGAAQPNMSGSQIGSIQLVLPTNEVLQKYNELINPMLNQILNLQQQNQNLKKSRDLLIPQLVGGLLEVQ
jgi:type I restriction enzyme, S subunit